VPSGRTGVFSTIPGVSFVTYQINRHAMFDVAGRWETLYNQLTAGGRMGLNSISAMRLKGLQLRDFQATLAMRRDPSFDTSYTSFGFAFNYVDNDNYDAILLSHWHSGRAGPPVAGGPYAIRVVDGLVTNGHNAYPGDRFFSRMPTFASVDVAWYRIERLNGYTKVWCLNRSEAQGAPSEGDWQAIVSLPVLAGTNVFRNTGGQFAFTVPHVLGHGHQGASFDDVTIKSWNASANGGVGAWVTEIEEKFTVDSSGYSGNETINDYSQKPHYDNNGNMLFDGTQVYTYDAWNRMKTVAHGYRDGPNVSDIHSGQVFCTTSYDAANRRIIKAISNRGYMDCTYHYYFDGDQFIEERNGSDQIIKDHVHGLEYIDEILQTRVNTNPMSTATWANYYPLQDANFNVMGVVNASGVLIERYEYDAYGKRNVYFSPGSNDPGCYAPLPQSKRVMIAGVMQPYGINDFGHQGLMHDEQIGLVYNWGNYLHSALGRPISPDGYWPIAGLNWYGYNMQNPIKFLDPTGLVPIIWTFSGVNNWDLPPNAKPGTPRQFNDYVGDTFRGSSQSFISQAGPGGAYRENYFLDLQNPNWNGGKNILKPSSRSILDAEAAKIASERPQGEFCRADGKKTVIKVLMIAPKTHTQPPKKDNCCCDIQVTTYWDPFDPVPNQGYGNGTETEAFWKQWGDVYTVRSNPAPGKTRHDFDGFLGKLDRIKYTATGSAIVRWVPTGQRAPNPVDVYNGWRNSSDADNVFVCHSQGCAMAQSIVGRETLGKEWCFFLPL
ncbi:MAG: hypothetical protein FWD53_13130, partial [Phycisphaerales bacterium]|nr:hypothetical protein [Phycisphaerales bacterium]